MKITTKSMKIPWFSRFFQASGSTDLASPGVERTPLPSATRRWGNPQKKSQERGGLKAMKLRIILWYEKAKLNTFILQFGWVYMGLYGIFIFPLDIVDLMGKKQYIYIYRGNLKWSRPWNGSFLFPTTRVYCRFIYLLTMVYKCV